MGVFLPCRTNRYRTKQSRKKTNSLQNFNCNQITAISDEHNQHISEEQASTSSLDSKDLSDMDTAGLLSRSREGSCDAQNPQTHHFMTDFCQLLFSLRPVDSKKIGGASVLQTSQKNDSLTNE